MSLLLPHFLFFCVRFRSFLLFFSCFVFFLFFSFLFFLLWLVFLFILLLLVSFLYPSPTCYLSFVVFLFWFPSLRYYSKSNKIAVVSQFTPLWSVLHHLFIDIILTWASLLGQPSPFSLVSLSSPQQNSLRLKGVSFSTSPWCAYIFCYTHSFRVSRLFYSYENCRWEISSIYSSSLSSSLRT